LALQQLEDAKKQADLDRVSVAEKQNTLAAQQKTLEQRRQDLATAQKNLEKEQANLQLLQNGSLPQDIESARQQVAAAQAALKASQQNLQYFQKQQKLTKLLMPFDGYLVDSFLEHKVGSYLSPGAVFATAQVKRKPLVEMLLPEYDATELDVGLTAEVKLLAYPTRPVFGKVISIEPASTDALLTASSSSTGSTSTTSTSTTLYASIFKVVIELESFQGLLKSGMSGYGKIDVGQLPVLSLLTRPLTRFIQVEIWSWLP
jgi:multidrug resistance efflux pump